VPRRPVFLERWVPSLALAAALTGTLTGCGASRHGADAKVLRRGQMVFSGSCAGCHTLTGREHGAEGGDLKIRGFTVGDFASFARIMPARPRLSEADVQAVAEYLHAVASHRR
jgi:mono/diheme cytochrome c family protein